MSRLHAAAAALAILASPALASPPTKIPTYVAAAVADPARPKDEVAADAARMPAQTLAFAGVEPGMKVAEFTPEGGYYTRMLIDVVGPKGAIYEIENPGWKDDFAADKKVLAEVNRPNLTLDAPAWGTVPVPAKVDLFWTTQNYHDLHIAKYGAVDMAAFNKAVFQALRPGGTYFILDHDAAPDAATDDIAKLHRIPKAQVIKEVTAAGFRLVGEGHFLERPSDNVHMVVFDKSVRGHTSQFALKFVRP
jgi:predicted methyltransferase